MDEITRLTSDEWKALGTKLFGEDMLEWKFICPICKHVQTPNDFKKYKDRGATPFDALHMCIGRYMPKEEIALAFGDNKGKKITSPCDYAAFGLFRVAPYHVTISDEEDVWCFAFAEVLCDEGT